MKPRLFIAVACSVLLCGCAPVLIRYKHVVVVESATLKVVERSTESNDSQGRPLSGRKIGLPAKSILSGNGYVVTILTPANSSRAVFLTAVDPNKRELSLRGAHLCRLAKKSGLGPDACGYAFLVEEAAGNPMDFDVVTAEGIILGHEKIEYDVISRGYVWIIDAV